MTVLFCSVSLFASAQIIQDTLLYKELAQRAKIDQYAANAYPPESEDISQKRWNQKKDSIFRDNKAFAERILNEKGFPGFDLVGKKGSYGYWLMVQHADFDPDFQQRVLDSMKVQLERNNANPNNYAFLTDRIRINTGRKQVYGTQLDIKMFTGKVKSLPTENWETINERRASLGMETIEEYLEFNQESHMESNATIIPGVTNVMVILCILIFFVTALIFVIIRRIKRGKRRKRS